MPSPRKNPEVHLAPKRAEIVAERIGGSGRKPARGRDSRQRRSLSRAIPDAGPRNREAALQARAWDAVSRRPPTLPYRSSVENLSAVVGLVLMDGPEDAVGSRPARAST